MTTSWIDLTAYLPKGFRLRKGVGGGDPANGLCYMETVALIAGEVISDHPSCACPVLTRYGIGLNDWFDDAQRQRLLPLAWATAGTRSPEHEQTRLRILGLAASDIAEMVLPIHAKRRPNDDRPRKLIEAARAYWRQPTLENKRVAYAAYAYAYAAATATAAAYAAAYVAATATAAAATATAATATAAAATATAAAATAAATAAADAYAAATADPGLRQRIVDRALEALREAIKAGPHGGLPDEAILRSRVDAVRGRLPVGAP
jgi:hypothetical protein